MRKGFTLIELMIVVAVLVTLMTMVFRLTSLGSSETARSTTIARLQRVENCLSGYFAAFGSYPPVAMHGTRDMDAAIVNGTQSLTQKNKIDWSTVDWDNWGDWDSDAEKSRQQAKAWVIWKQVQPACRSQPVDVAFPFPASSYFVQLASTVYKELYDKANDNSGLYPEYQHLQEMLGSPFSILQANAASLDSDSTDWDDVKVFKFGLLSYILPRYLVMMGGGDASSGENLYEKFMQWSGSNQFPSDPFTGLRSSGKNGDNPKWSWSSMHQNVLDINNDTNGTDAEAQKARIKIESIPSQAVCARWMPNLEGLCSAEHNWKFFGVNITGEYLGNLSGDNPYIQIYTMGKDGSGDRYVLDTITVLDGWGHSLYYYSPAPYQSYVLWSAGADGYTYPPWVPRGDITDDNEKKGAAAWTKDDITNLSH